MRSRLNAPQLAIKREATIGYLAWIDPETRSLLADLILSHIHATYVRLSGSVNVRPKAPSKHVKLIGSPACLRV